MGNDEEKNISMLPKASDIASNEARKIALERAKETVHLLQKKRLEDKKTADILIRAERFSADKKSLSLVHKTYYKEIVDLVFSRTIDDTITIVLDTIDFDLLLADRETLNYIIVYLNNNTRYGAIDDEEKLKSIFKTLVNNKISKGIFSSNLIFYCTYRHIRRSQLAERLDIPLSTVSDWFRAVNYPRADKMVAIAEVLEIPYDFLTAKIPRQQINLEILRNKLDYINRRKGKTENSTVKIPIYGQIPAGIPNEAIEYIEDWEEIPASWTNSDKEFFALKIRGNSMSPDYHDGDIVIFQRASRCVNGKNCAVMIDNTDVTFKKWIQTDAGIILQPLNEEEFDPIFFSKKQIVDKRIKIIGIPKEVRRKID